MEDFTVNLNDLPDEIDFDTEIVKPKRITKNQKIEQTKPKREYVAKIKFEKLVAERVKSFKEIVGLELIENVQYRIVTTMSFNAVTVLSYLLEFYKIVELSICVYRLNNKSFDVLKDLIIKDNVKCKFLVSIMFKNNKKYERWVYDLKDLAANRKNILLGFGNTHAKIMIAKTDCGKKIVFEGSGNFTHNERLEQYIYENNKQSYDFHNEWIFEEIKKYGSL